MEILGHIPKHGTFKYNGKFYFYVHLFPLSYNNEYKLPITSVATSFQPICKIISLSSVKLVKLKALWPSTKVERGDTVMYRFVPL